jgi:hypothetical protein
MYYTPAVVVPGKLAHIKLENAQTTAKMANTYVMDNEFNIIKDYRDKKTV